MVQDMKDEKLIGKPGYRFTRFAIDPRNNQQLPIDFYDGQLGFCKAVIRDTDCTMQDVQPNGAAAAVWLKYVMYYPTGQSPDLKNRS
jgi:hypothetical protein